MKYLGSRNTLGQHSKYFKHQINHFALLIKNSSSQMLTSAFLFPKINVNVEHKRHNQKILIICRKFITSQLDIPLSRLQPHTLWRYSSRGCAIVNNEVELLLRLGNEFFGWEQFLAETIGHTLLVIIINYQEDFCLRLEHNEWN